MNIISASRRTDIPHYYALWFSERRKAGFAEYRTVFGGGKNGRFRVSLDPKMCLDTSSGPSMPVLFMMNWIPCVLRG
ncbi:MAG: DUF1848 family protein [Syntrophobacteraceae bacterium]